MRIPGPALVLPVFLAGCALPPAVTVASLVADGVSYVTTGKSTTDHAISAFAREDCALLRAVEGNAICDPDGKVLVALTGASSADDDWYYDAETGSRGIGDPAGLDAGGDLGSVRGAAPAVPLQVSASNNAHGDLKTLGETAGGSPTSTAGPAGQGKTLALAGAPAIADKSSPRGSFDSARPTAKPQAFESRHRDAQRRPPASDPTAPVATYAVIGSFRDADNARRMAQTRDKAAILQTIVVNGKTTYRVLLDQPVEQARAAGFADAWPVQLCAGDLAAPPCGPFAARQAGDSVQLASLSPTRHAPR